MSLKDRVVVITGAGGSLGPTVCREFAAAGARLALAGTRPDHLQALAASLGLPLDQWLVHAARLQDPAGAQSLAEAVRVRFGRADAVLHLVGGYTAGQAVADLDPADVANMLDQHLWTTLHVARAFLPLLLANNWGRLVTISSPAGQTPAAKSAPYAVGKAAQDNLMAVLAQELKGSGVTANTVVVRSIETGPSRTGSSPAEVAAALLWLCSDEAGAVNGARIPLYGR